MSDDTRREELKAEINEALDNLLIEDLEAISGGGILKLWQARPHCKKCRVYFPVKYTETVCRYCGGPLD